MKEDSAKSFIDSTLSGTKLREEYQRFLPFIYEVRKRLLIIVSVFVIGSVLGFLYYEKVVRFILGLFNLDGVNIVFTSPFQFINLAMTSGFLTGLLFVFPMILWQIVSFLKPALSKTENKTIKRMIPVTIILFIFGFTYGIFMMRYVLALFYEKSLELNIGNFLDVSAFISQMLTTSALMGLAFEFPIVLTAIIKLGVIKYNQIAKQRIVAYSASLIFAALLPPTDLLSLLLLTMPLIILFESTLVFNKLLMR
jgi:sec-independent protein translocase protein TatC